MLPVAHRSRVLALALTLPLGLAACASNDGGAPAEETATATAEALTSTLPAGVTNIVTSGTVNVGACGGLCMMSAGTAQLAVFGPPQFISFVHRGKGCGGTFGYEILGQNSRRATVAIAAGPSGEVAIAAAESVGTSGSSPNKLVVWRLDPTTLATVAGGGLQVPPTGGNPVNATINLTSLAFTMPGDVVVVGTKIGAIPGELGTPGGGNYQLTYAGFATSTAMNLAPTQLLAW